MSSCSPDAASNARWFFLGIGCGEILCVLSLHFLTRPGIELNWVLVGAAFVLIGVFAWIERWARSTS